MIDEKTLLFIYKFERMYSRGDIAICWPWQGPRDNKGYGRMTIRKRSYLAHRISYSLHNRVAVPPSKIFICHRCDNPICVNPHHLFAGDLRSNNADARLKRRSIFSPGEFNHNAKLSEADVIYIRKNYIPYHNRFGGLAMAKQFKVSRTAINYILKGINWSYLDDRENDLPLSLAKGKK